MAIDQTHTTEVEPGWGGLILSWGGFYKNKCSYQYKIKYESKYLLRDHTPEAPLKLSVSTHSCRSVSQSFTPLSPVSDSVFIAWPYALKNHNSEAESMFLSLKKGDLGVQAGRVTFCSFTSPAL